MSDGLPKGWEIATLSEIADINPRHPKGLDDSMPVSFAPMAVLSETRPELSSLEERPLGEVRKGFTHFAEGDVLFAKITPSMENGKGAVATGLRNGLGCGTTELHVIRPLAGIDPYYLYRFVSQRSIRRAAKENFTGTAGQLRVPSAFIEKLSIPLAPINEQHRIVPKLEKLFGKVDACKQRLTKIPVILKRFRQSVLAAACSGRLTADWREGHLQSENGDPKHRLQEISRQRKEIFEIEVAKALAELKKKPKRPSNLELQVRENTDGPELPYSWFWMSFEDAASTEPHALSSGPFGSALGRKDYVESGIPVVRGQNIQGGQFLATNFVFVSSQKADELRRSITKPGDIIIVAVGSSGESAIIPDDIPLAVLSQNCNKITVDSELVIPRFVNFVLQVEISREQMRDKTTDTARPFLSLTNVKTTLLPIPSLPEQYEIIRRVERLFVLADQIEARFAKATARVDQITQSLLAKAFLGELVPQNPNDEPASVLLERIKTARAKAETDAKGGGKKRLNVNRKGKGR